MNWSTFRMKAQLSVLKEVAKDYPTASLDNVIRQIESRVKYIESQI